jgi:Arm DNA-binding domain
MAVVRLTDLSVRSFKEGIYYDDKTPGFGIRIGKRRKTWHVVKQPDRTKVTIGYYPNLSLADARKKALVTLGTPGIPVKTELPAFPDTRAEYLAQGKWRPHSRYQVTRTLTRHFHWTKNYASRRSRSDRDYKGSQRGGTRFQRYPVIFQLVRSTVSHKLPVRRPENSLPIHSSRTRPY